MSRDLEPIDPFSKPSLRRAGLPTSQAFFTACMAPDVREQYLESHPADQRRLIKAAERRAWRAAKKRALKERW